MTNNREMYCNHCKKETLFILESDLLWYCDECGHAADSWQEDAEEDSYFEEEELEKEQSIRCPDCKNRILVGALADGYLCPVCFEDLSEELEGIGYEPEGDLWE